MARPTQIGLSGGWSLRQAARITGVAASTVAAVRSTPPLSEGDITDGDLLSLKLLSVIDGFRDDALWGAVPEQVAEVRAKEIHRAAQAVWASRSDAAVLLVSRASCWLALTVEDRTAVLDEHAGEAVVILPAGGWAREMRNMIEAARAGITK